MKFQIKLYITLVLITSILSITYYSCKSSTESGDATDSTILHKVTIEGTVIDNSTNNPISDAVVRIKFDSTEVGGSTNSSGVYSIIIEIKTAKELTIICSKEGYKSDTVKAYAVPNRKTTSPNSYLSKTNTSGGGEPASIYLYAQTRSTIGVIESGSVETAKITFQVLDPKGVPIDFANSVTVNFKVGAAPNGGEYIYPFSAKTDHLGTASVNLVSGKKAGAVQIVAEVLYNNKTILSKPVSITIHGGLPDQAHFSIAPLNVNFPGYHIFGLSDPISVYVGDKYGNPVVPNTAVYFTSTGGIIQGSALTSQSGIGTVNLISALPHPDHALLGKGFATITATTADENKNMISVETVVLFSSGPSILNIIPNTFDIPNGGSQTFDYLVADENLNPLSKGQKIEIVMEGENVKLTGDYAIDMPDTQSKAWTQFSFTITDTNDSLNVPKAVNIKLSTSGPNGTAKMSIKGIAR